MRPKTRTKEDKTAYNMQYAKEKIKRIPLDVQNEYYETVLKPYCEKTNTKMNSLIKLALKEYMENHPLK